MENVFAVTQFEENLQSILGCQYGTVGDYGHALPLKQIMKAYFRNEDANN